MHHSLLRANFSRKPSRRTRPAWLLGAGLFTCVLLGAGIAIADIPDGNTINACRNKTTFAIRVIDKDLGQSCTASETAFRWTNWTNRGAWSALVSYRAADVVSYNGSGYIAKLFPPKGVVPTNTTYWGLLVSKGADGAVGPQGPAGKDGPPGADGAVGPQGPAGKPGADGAVGPAGPAGKDGLDGATGPQGPAGKDGATGPQGPAGNDGATGPQGPAGADGATGATGATGPQGPAGPAGPPGVVGKIQLAGSASSVALTGGWQFLVVSPDKLQVTTGQTLLGSAGVSLSSSSASSVQIDLCFADSQGGPIIAEHPLTISSVATQSGYGVSEFLPQATLGGNSGDFYNLGLCIKGSSGNVTVSVSGWIMLMI